MEVYILSRVDWTIGPDDWTVQNYMGVRGIYKSYREAIDAAYVDRREDYEDDLFLFDSGEMFVRNGCIVSRHKFEVRVRDPDPTSPFSRPEGMLQQIDYYITQTEVPE